MKNSQSHQADEVRKCPSTIRRLENLGCPNSQGICNRFERSQPYFPLASLHFADVILVNMRVFRQIDLSPSALLSKQSDSLPNTNTDIGCHPSSIAIICDSKSLHKGTEPTLLMENAKDH